LPSSMRRGNSSSLTAWFRKSVKLMPQNQKAAVLKGGIPYLFPTR